MNGVNLTDLVLLNGDEVIPAPKTFVSSVRTSGNVNLMSLESPGLARELYENTLLYDANQTISGTLEFGAILVPQGATLDSILVNGVDLRNLMHDAVFIDIPQIITGAKKFHNSVTTTSMSFQGNFDGVTDWDMKQNWMLQGVNQTLFGDLVFERAVHIAGSRLEVGNAMINGLNLIQLSADIVKVDEPAHIQGD